MDEFMDEYTMSWSDAVRTEADYLRIHPRPSGNDSPCGYGILGTALWNQRCLAGARAALDASAHEQHSLRADAGHQHGQTHARNS
jgi:hypothetical protein